MVVSSMNWTNGTWCFLLLLAELLMLRSYETLRYREVPTFGLDTIRKFSTNCSEMKQLAAHDFEDLLQV